MKNFKNKKMVIALLCLLLVGISVFFVKRHYDNKKEISKNKDTKVVSTFENKEVNEAEKEAVTDEKNNEIDENNEEKPENDKNVEEVDKKDDEKEKNTENKTLSNNQENKTPKEKTTSNNESNTTPSVDTEEESKDNYTTKTEYKTDTKTIGYKTIYKNDSSLQKGKTKVLSSGSNGIENVKYKRTVYLKNGSAYKTSSWERVSSSVSKSAVNRVIAKGTKHAPDKWIIVNGMGNSGKYFKTMAQAQNWAEKRIRQGNEKTNPVYYYSYTVISVFWKNQRTGEVDNRGYSVHFRP